MSGQEVIEVEIDQQGTPTISVQGIAGKACQDLTKGIEAALGKVAKSEPTREMSQQAEHSRKLGAR